MNINDKQDIWTNGNKLMYIIYFVLVGFCLGCVFMKLIG
jgi:hypothetical protein